MSCFEELNDNLQNESLKEMKEKVFSAGLPLHAEKAAAGELESLASISDADSEEYRERASYIRYLLSLPWNSRTENSTQAPPIESILEESYPASESSRQKIYSYLVQRVSAGRKAKLLVVDDEVIALKSLEKALRKEGYDVVPARSGAEAIEILGQSHFDVVITDLIMGDIDGYDVLHETKKRYPDTRLIMITGYATVDTAVQALRLGAFHYIEKPLRLDEVREAVRDALGDKVPAKEEPVLCFAGPSKPDMISLGRRIASVLGRKFSIISLSDVDNTTAIRGRNRMEGNAMPGSVIEEIRRTGVGNPVIMIVDLEKTAPDMNDAIQSDLLHAFDPCRNGSFIDCYLDVPFDLSSVLFIITVNSTESIVSPLRKLMQVIEC